MLKLITQKSTASKTEITYSSDTEAKLALRMLAMKKITEGYAHVKLNKTSLSWGASAKSLSGGATLVKVKKK